MSAKKLFKELKDNQIKGDTDKCHSILNTRRFKSGQIGNSLIKSSHTEKLLDVNFNDELVLAKSLS